MIFAQEQQQALDVANGRLAWANLPCATLCASYDIWQFVTHHTAGPLTFVLGPLIRIFDVAVLCFEHSNMLACWSVLVIALADRHFLYSPCHPAVVATYETDCPSIILMRSSATSLAELEQIGARFGA